MIGWIVYVLFIPIIWLILSVKRTKRIILLSGLPGSGKDFVADVLVEKGYARLAFADALKTMTSKKYGIPLSQFNDRYQKDTPLPDVRHTPREILHYAASIFTQDDPLLFAKMVVDQIKWAVFNENFVVSDLRYKKELTHIKRSFKSVQISAIWISRANAPAIKDNIEISQTDCDGFVANGSTTSKLQELIRTIN